MRQKTNTYCGKHQRLYCSRCQWERQEWENDEKELEELRGILEPWQE